MNDKLNKLLQNSYAPYSKINVAAIVIMKDGTEISGVNVENAAYPSGLCAERNAIFSAITKGYKNGDFQELHLTSNLDKPLFPCGACRQVMAEHFTDETSINIHGGSEVIKHDINDLLPGKVTKGSFGWK